MMMIDDGEWAGVPAPCPSLELALLTATRATQDPVHLHVSLCRKGHIDCVLSTVAAVHLLDDGYGLRHIDHSRLFGYKSISSLSLIIRRHELALRGTHPLRPTPPASPLSKPANPD